MNKLTKILVSMILILVAVGILSTSVADTTEPDESTTYANNLNVKIDDLKIGETFSLSFKEYNDEKNINKLLCIEHKDILSSAVYNTYTVQNIITITRDTATGVINEELKELKGEDFQAKGENAKLAAAIQYTKGEARRYAVWYYMYNWMKAIGTNFDNLKMDLVNSDNGGFSSTPQEQKIEPYVKSITTGEAVKVAYVQSEETEVKVQPYTRDNKQYIKVGPFKLDFYPQLNSITITGRTTDSGNSERDLSEDVIIIQDQENDGTAETISINELKKKTNFYLLIPTNVKKITKIEVKTEETDIATNITAKIAFLKTEKGSDAYQNLILVETEVEEGTTETAEFSYPNTPISILGNLKVIKVDKDKHQIKLKDVEFIIKQQSTGKYVKRDSNGNISYVDEESKATKFTTDKNGEILINNLIVGNYVARETKNPNYGYDIINEGKQVEVTVEVDKTNEYTVENKLATGNLKIIKVNKDDDTIRLSGVGFKIQNKDTEEYVRCDSNGNISYVDESNATEFSTDENGEILINNLIVGTYVAYETQNPNYGYEIIRDGQEIAVTIDATAESKILNEQRYIKLSGYVWVDNIDIGKTSARNDLFHDSDYDEADTLLNGITVRLKNKNTGATIATTTSKLDRYTENDGNGEYLFEDVEIAQLGNYYIEFEYDGLTYTNVVANINENNGSKAAESGTTRETFNKNFSVVEGDSRDRDTGYTRDANGDTVHTLSYDIETEPHVATLINNGQYTITANTDVPRYIIEDHFDYGQEEIKYINLGLYEREQPDIAIVTDLQNVRLTINGYEHTYNYAQRFQNAGEYGDGFNVGVKFGNKYGSMSYTRAIYKADYEYKNEDDTSKELKVYVTYQLTMRNQSSNLTAQINSIADYFDSKYDIVNVGTSLDEKGNVVGDITHTETDYSDDDYKKTVINNNTKIEAQKEESIYVQFALNREAVINILNSKENLDNVAEINSYSIYDGNHNIYAGIDTDSNPGNCIPGDTKTYEDDTDSSPALQLEVAKNAREMTGTVFVDNALERGNYDDPSGLMTGEIRQGNGEYNDGETTIEGVEVTLEEINGAMKYKTKTVSENGKYKVNYTYKNDDGEIVTITNENDIPAGTTIEVNLSKSDDDTAIELNKGDFLIIGYMPGDYTLTYTWGDETYTVQDYKGTIYKSNRDQSNNWYKENVDTRYSDAIDNYKTRQAIDQDISDTYSSQVNNITKMNSTTPTMGIGVEYETTYTASMGDQYTYRIKNIDFGIVERARQVLDISKSVTGVKITLANGQTIVDAQVVDGKLEGDTIKGLTYMGPANGDNGFVKAEIDNELIQGATIQIEYTITVENKSEKDYATDAYYIYGTIDNEHEEDFIITLKPEGVYDYLDSQMVLDENKDNSKWVISNENYNTTYENDTLIESFYNSSSSNNSGDQTEITTWEISQTNYQTLFTQWFYNKTEGQTIRDVKLENKTILNNTDLEKTLAPGGKNTATLYTSKVLANTDEIYLDNDTEITQVIHEEKAGRTLDITTSYIYDKGESVIVTTPTGENQNYILPIIIGITSFIILGVGIIIIKKKVL